MRGKAMASHAGDTGGVDFLDDFSQGGLFPRLVERQHFAFFIVTVIFDFHGRHKAAQGMRKLPDRNDCS